MLSEKSLFNQFKDWQKKITSLKIRGVILSASEHPLINTFREEGTTQDIPFKNNKSNATKDLLGSENTRIIFDAQENFDSNLFAASSGSLIGGGLLIILLTSDAIDYALRLKNDRANLNSSKHLCPVLKRVISQLIDNFSTAIAHSDQFLINSLLMNKKLIEANDQFKQQKLAIQKIKRVVKGHANRPLVITANRGRGKSAALGIACAKLLLEDQLTIIVTSPLYKNLTVFYKHLLNSNPTFMDNLQPSNLPFNNKKITLTNGSQILFIPPDEIIRNPLTTNLLIIDEAAAIPVSQLQKLTKSFNRIVFATTTYGYEGNGKGFEVRFKQHLIKAKPATQFITLENPIRWSEQDELEKSSFEALLLDCQLNSVKDFNDTNIINNMTYQVLSKETLQTNEALLRQVFALLINAHYQTRPADLKTILAEPNIEVLSASYNQQIIAVALINREGGLDKMTCNKIVASEKRLKGELLPQSILAHFGIIEAGALSYNRIMRIAVHPQLQNKGIGSHFINYIETYSKAKNAHFIGASFAATDDVVSFWLNNQFTCIRFGYSKDSSSGAHTLEVLKALDIKAQPIIQLLKSRFQTSFLFKLNSTLQDISLSLINKIIMRQIKFSPDQLSDYEKTELQYFVEGKRGVPMVDDLIIKLFKCYISHSVDQKSNGRILNSSETNFMFDFVFKKSDLNLLSIHFNFTGKKQAAAHLRLLTQKLLSDKV